MVVVMVMVVVMLMVLSSVVETWVVWCSVMQGESGSVVGVGVVRKA